MQARKTTGQDLAAFQVIVDFVTNLHTYFESKVHSVTLYHRLIYQKSFQDEDLILRHVSIFRSFCETNRIALRERNEHKLSTSRISFSDRIYIDLNHVFSHVDAETKSVVWEYLLAISAHVDPQSGSLQQLQQLQQQQTAPTPPPQDPMAMMGSLMSNPAIGGMMSSLMNGNIDLQKLITSITPIVENVKKEIESSDDPNIKNLVQMVQSMDLHDPQPEQK
jgi:hypothetical protein